MNHRGAEWLADKTRFVRHRARFGPYVPGRDNDRDMRPGRGDAARQGKAIKLAWHLDIGEQQHNLWVPRFEQVKRSITPLSIQHLEACLFKDVHGFHANKEVVIHDECILGIRNLRDHQKLR